MDPDIAADLALIREAMGPAATDEEAAAIAIQTLASHIRSGRLVMDRESLNSLMTSYAAYCLSMYAQTPVVPVETGEGEIAFVEVDAMPERPAFH